MSQRISVAERMDDPHCDPNKLTRTYHHLAWLNRWFSRMPSLMDRYILDEVHAEQRANPNAHPPHVVDVGCGGGDVLHGLARKAARSNLRLVLTGIDPDERAVSHARRRSQARKDSDVMFRQMTVADLSRLDPPPDYIVCNHVLHHLEDDEIPGFLRALYSSARRRVLVNDLLRSAWFHAGCTVLTGAFLHRSFAFHDSRLSIRRGLRPDELMRHLHQSGLQTRTQVTTLFPGRVVMVGAGYASQSTDVMTPTHDAAACGLNS